MGSCDSSEQVVFPASIEDEVRARIVEVADSSGRLHVFPKAGVCLEWTRSTRRDDAYLAGRLYLDGKWSEAEPRVAERFRDLIEWVQSTYPLVTDGRFPVFVGPELAKMIQSGQSAAVFPNGKEMLLLGNPKSKQ